MLAHRALRPYEVRGRLLVPRSLQNQQRHVTFGACQLPSVELTVDGLREPGQRRLGALSPDIPFRLTLHQQALAFLERQASTAQRRRRSTPSAERHDGERKATHDHSDLEQHMKRPDAVGRIENQAVVRGSHRGARRRPNHAFRLESCPYPSYVAPRKSTCRILRGQG